MFATSQITGWEALCERCWAVSLSGCQDGELLSPPFSPVLAPGLCFLCVVKVAIHEEKQVTQVDFDGPGGDLCSSFL